MVADRRLLLANARTPANPYVGSAVIYVESIAAFAPRMKPAVREPVSVPLNATVLVVLMGAVELVNVGPVRFVTLITNVFHQASAKRRAHHKVVLAERYAGSRAEPVEAVKRACAGSVEKGLVARIVRLR